LKSGNCAAAAGLLLLACALPLAANAGKGGPFAEGSVRLSAGGLRESIEFSAAADGDGNAAGRMTFTEAPAVTTHDTDAGGDQDTNGARLGVSFSADFDCLSVVSNRAVMSGVVTHSTPEGYAGRRVVLAVLDNGDGAGQGRRDGLTWGVYRRNERGWTASDAEENDSGPGLTWTATDAEREDDAGEPSDRVEATTCKNIPVSSFSLIELKEGEGDVRVRP
jgi:hypothetical protein